MGASMADSMLVVKQLNGARQPKAGADLPLYREATTIEGQPKLSLELNTVLSAFKATKQVEKVH